MPYRQAMLYGVRDSYGRNILEGEMVIVAADSAGIIILYGILQDAAAEHIVISDMDGQEHTIKYGDIDTIRQAR